MKAIVRRSVAAVTFVGLLAATRTARERENNDERRGREKGRKSGQGAAKPGPAYAGVA
jgi:hypothetical protein